MEVYDVTAQKLDGPDRRAHHQEPQADAAEQQPQSDAESFTPAVFDGGSEGNTARLAKGGSGDVVCLAGRAGGHSGLSVGVLPISVQLPDSLGGGVARLGRWRSNPKSCFRGELLRHALCLVLLHRKISQVTMPDRPVIAVEGQRELCDQLRRKLRVGEDGSRATVAQVLVPEEPNDITG